MKNKTYLIRFLDGGLYPTRRKPGKEYGKKARWIFEVNDQITLAEIQDWLANCSQETDKIKMIAHVKDGDIKEVQS